MAEPRFAALRTLREQPGEQAAPERPQETGEGAGRPVSIDSPVHVPRRPGRPNGKRSNPDYERMNLIVRKSTRRKVDLKILQEGIQEDLSELVDRLLNEWAG